MAASPQVQERRRHRVLIPLVLTMAVLIGFVASFAVWVNRQALDTNNWTNTSAQLLADEKVNAALSTYLVNELFASVNVAEELRTSLPTQLKALADPASAGLRALAERAAPKVLASPQVQQAWRRANHAAHAALMHILNGGGTAISAGGGVVTLNVHELLAQLAAQLGLHDQLATVTEKRQSAGGQGARTATEAKLGTALPPASGEIVIMRSGQLAAAQDVAKAIRGLAIALPLVMVALFALAIWLDRGRRRLALRNTAWCLLGIGVLVLLARRIAGDQIVNGLVRVPANKPAAQQVWSIGTSLLYDIAVAALAYGLLLVAAAWLSGTTRPAIALRRALAPWVREHAAGSYAVAGGLLLLLVLWGPTPATRQLIPVLGFAVLAAAGVWTLRAMTQREFPDARAGEATAGLRQLLAGGWAASRGKTGHHDDERADADRQASGTGSH